MYSYVYGNTIHNRQNMETTETSIEKWLDKEDVVHIDNAVLLSHEKKKRKEKKRNNPFAETDEPGDCHTKWSKSERESQISY